MAPKFITDQVARLALQQNYQKLFQRLERALGQFSSNSGTIVQPVRTELKMPKPGRVTNSFLTMPAYSELDGAISAKLLSSFPGNTDCPTLNSVIALFSVENGCLDAIMDGNAITELRTAMASAVAVHHLTDPSRMRTLAIVGAGVQGRGHADVFKAMFNFHKIKIWSRTFSNAKKLAEEKQLEAFETIQETVHDADVIITATNSAEPIVRADWLKAGAMICSVGACRSDWRELEDAIMTSSFLVADTREGVLQEAGDVIQTKTRIHAELGEIINGSKTVDKKKDLIVFKSVGMAVEDTVAARIIHEN